MSVDVSDRQIAFQIERMFGVAKRASFTMRRDLVNFC